MGAAADNTVIVWQPQPGPQTALLTCPVFEVFYGGARGGGKTQGMLGDFASHAGEFGAEANGLMIRRTRVELADTIEKSKAIYGPIGAKFHEQDKYWRFPDGAKLTFAYLERDADAEAYQGHGYTRIYVEEIGNFPDPKPIRKLFAALRSGGGVPVGFRATGNPGGAGHQWVKGRYIDPAPKGYQIIRDEETGLERVFIPAKVSDNQILMENDPGYVNRLKSSGSASLVKAWLDGDWDVVEGAFFDGWMSTAHVIRPLALPQSWTRFRALDWGFAKPFSVGWYAISDGELPQFPKGAIIKYREWYGKKEPNVGIRLDAEDLGRGVLEREKDDPPAHNGGRRLGVADPSIFAEDGGPSIAERMSNVGCAWYPADNKRIPGWDQVRSRLQGEDDIGTGNRPMLYFFETCIDSIRTIPALQHDETKAEDLDTDGEDHAADETRYACMSRPYVRAGQPAPQPKYITIGGKTTVTMNDAWKERDRQRAVGAGRI
jgi:hypothetical protein